MDGEYVYQNRASSTPVTLTSITSAKSMVSSGMEVKEGTTAQ